MKEKKIRQKLLSILMAAAMILVQLPVTAFAATAGENSRPGTYTGTAEGFGGETVTVQLTVDEDHKISGITASSSRTADTAEGGGSATFWKNALTVLESIKTANGTDGVNAVSGATYSSTAMINAANAALVSAGNVYVSGSGSDEGDGSPDAPAATFAKAKELLGSNAGTIYVSGTISVTGEESWTLAEGQSLARADGFTGALRECNEGVLSWVDKAAVPALPMWEGDKIFFRLLAEDAPFFLLKLRYEGDTLAEAALNGAPVAL